MQRNSSAVAAIWLTEATTVQPRKAGVDFRQRLPPVTASQATSQPQRRERQPIEEPHQGRAERTEIAGQMALRRVAQGLRQRRAERYRDPGPGQIGKLNAAAGASGSKICSPASSSSSLNPIAARNASRTSAGCPVWKM